MSPQMLLHATVLFASAAVAVWTFIVIRGRSDDAPGRAALGGLMLAVALWCVTSGLHAIVTSIDTRVALSEIQYFGVASAAPLWMLFASQYARLRWTSDPVLRAALWIIPVATVLLALTNPMHRLLWTDIVPVDTAGGSRLVYVHGPWFWVAVTFSYFCLAVGTIVLVRAMKGAPVGPRPRVALALAGVALPWMANVLYLAGALPAGLDPTPVAFALSGASILLSIYRHRLFTLVPIARDLVIESMDAAVFVLGPGRKIVDFNPAAHRLTGCADESAGEPIDSIVPWWRQASANGRLAAGIPVVVDVGSSRLEVQMTAIHDAQEMRAGWVVVMREIAERRVAEAERSAIERRMQEQQRAESLSVLTAGAAHEFNHLLNGILGRAERLVLESEPGSAARENAEAVVHGAQRAVSLVEKMLAYCERAESSAEGDDLAAAQKPDDR